MPPTAPKGGSDDVKYHLGAEGAFLAADDSEVRVTLSPNPSHLEAVNPVIEGRTRAEQTDRSQPDRQRRPRHDALPVLIHGDAAFAAQGVVAETLNLARLDGYDDRRHGPPHRQQPGRLHDRPARGPLDRLLAPTSRRASTCRSSTSTPMTRRPASPPRAWR